MSRAQELVTHAAFYREHEKVIEEVVDELIAECREMRTDADVMNLFGESGVVAALVVPLLRNHDRAVTVAAAAIARLSRTEDAS